VTSSPQKLSLFASAALLFAGTALAQNVPTYHATPNRHGAYTVTGLTPAAAASLKPLAGFSATISGDVYAQPLYWKTSGQSNGEIIQVTENNIVYSLNATTGTVNWSTQLAPAAPLSAFPCGNINPEGITGTPVIDPVHHVIYLNALTYSASKSAQHLLYGISLNTGAILSGWPLDIGAALTAKGVSFSALTQGQRSALQIFNGNVYVNYGGKAGDCGTYHGTVVQVDTTTKTVTASWSTRANGGGIWAQGGLAREGSTFFATTGNTMGATTWEDGEAIVRLLPGLAHSTETADYFAPTDWLSLDESDSDLGGTEAIPFSVAASGGKSVGRVIALGKDGNAYLVNQAKLGGIGGQIQEVNESSSQIITAPVVYESPSETLVAFTNHGSLSPCSGTSITALKIAATGTSPISAAWCAGFNGAGSPIITTSDGTSNPIVWVTGAEGDNQVHGFNALTGAVVFSGSGTTMQGLRHFGTLIAAQGNLYVGADNTVYAFTFTP